MPTKERRMRQAVRNQMGVNQSTGKRGRPKGSKNTSTIIKEFEQGKLYDDMTKAAMTNGPKLIEEVWKRAMDGDQYSTKLCFDYIFKEMSGTGSGNGKIVINIGGLTDAQRNETWNRLGQAGGKEPLTTDWTSSEREEVQSRPVIEADGPDASTEGTITITPARVN